MRKILSVFLLISLCLCIVCHAENSVLDTTVQYITETVTAPQVSSVGGEWTVIGLARSGAEISDEYYNSYIRAVKNRLDTNSGILSNTKYTEYSRVVIALCALGKNPQDFYGYNLLTPLSDFDKVTAQGVNGAIWALIALDCAEYETLTREMYIEYILNSVLEDGGWSLTGEGAADPDITAMAIVALSGYADRFDTTVSKAVDCLAKIQDSNGGFQSMGDQNCESTAQVIVALCEAGISPQSPEFVKNGNSLLDNLMSFYTGGGFAHTAQDTEPSLMTTEQALCALAASDRFESGKPGLYTMTDCLQLEEQESDSAKKLQIVSPDIGFEDIGESVHRAAIISLAQRGVITGKAEGIFDPVATMTRAEFATIVVRALALETAQSNNFSDVAETDWFYDAVNTAYENNIAAGTGDGKFNPNGTITREEAAVMVGRAAGLCGLNTAMDKTAARDVLAGFVDYMQISDWAVEAMAFCFESGIADDSATEVLPQTPILRDEVAGLIFNMLERADMI